MFAHEAPYLKGLHGGAQLRTEMTKIQNYAELDALRGGKFGEEVFLPFCEEMLKLVPKKSGTPADGPFLGLGIKDLRPLSYKVMSAMRLDFDNTEDYGTVQTVTDFYTFFAEKWGEVEGGLVNSVVIRLSTSSIEAGTTTTATLTVLPENAKDKSVTWRSSDTSVATVDQKGVITGVAAGNSTITAEANDGSGISGMATISVTAAK